MINAMMHGGPDALGVPVYDFSTNVNACGPCPPALAAVQAADAVRYPDPAYTALRQRLAGLHGVAPARVLLAGSASEFIGRVSAWVRQQGGVSVHLPPFAYGDYARTAQAWGLQQVADADAADLVWACEPSSPLGQAHTDWPAWLTAGQSDAPVEPVSVTPPFADPGLLVLDGAYAPLRLSAADSLSLAQRERVWQLYSPNKALGLTGVRAAYVIAPCGQTASLQAQIENMVADLERLAPSWHVGGHGVALLHAWASAPVQLWLSQSLPLLRDWKARQTAMLASQGWQVQPSAANFFCARAPQPLDLAALRAQHGIKLRDCTSFGLPGWVRLGVLAPAAQDALAFALLDVSRARLGLSP